MGRKDSPPFRVQVLRWRRSLRYSSDELWRLRWQRDRLERKYDRQIHKAKKEKNDDERDSLITAAEIDRMLFDDDISSADTIQLRRQAERLGLPVPAASDKNSWEDGMYHGVSYLNPAARTALRQAIRRERRER